MCVWWVSCSINQDQFTYKIVDILDWDDADIYSHFESCLQFIDHAKKSGGGVLVHWYFNLFLCHHFFSLSFVTHHTTRTHSPTPHTHTLTHSLTYFPLQWCWRVTQRNCCYCVLDVYHENFIHSRTKNRGKVKTND